MASDQLSLVFYIFIAIFSITAILTFLGITGVIKSIQPKHLNVLFTGLIMEVVAAVIFSYKQIDFSCQTEVIVDKLGSTIGKLPDDYTLDQKVETLEAALVKGIESENEVVRLKGEITQLESTLSACKQSQGTSNDELSKLDKVFYSNVIKLRIVSEQFRGRTINLIWDKESKTEVYQILGQIFLELGYVGPNDQLTDDYIIKKYIRFAKDSGWEYLLKTDEEGNYTQVLVDEYATTIFLRKYLNQKYPLKKPAE